MEAFKHQLEEVQIQPPKRKKRQKNNDGWVMSFADVVTVLLCFFIIFYMIEKQYDKNYGFGMMQGRLQEYKTKMKKPEVLSLIQTLKELPQVTLENHSQFIEVHFPAEMFFDSGKTSLTAEGKAVVERLIEPLSQIHDGYILQIQGYTDDSPVRNLQNRWWKNNMELSLERSLEVYDLFVSRGIKKSILSVTGYGANKPLRNKSKNLQRRISIKFEPVLYEKS